ncbi:HIRAN domain-containing protein [Salinibacterium sp. SWN167]|uniref:HIRAN domain-containing protein n=1 Tax=Salinibacterium sp. SWN167 TaxID=2792054 RepID=UPI0018CC9D63|nr:HIRAN domain-containing protein [Salinibacterium sp. SWN167]MBH0082448.1 HIRAN domain-containing protein [Salinibacterium sp. SWN167]
MAEVIIVGGEHSGDPAMRPLKSSRARLVRERGNKHDKNAVAVYVESKKSFGRSQLVKAGYVSSARAELIAPHLETVGGEHEVTLSLRDRRAFVEVPDEWLVRPSRKR